MTIVISSGERRGKSRLPESETGEKMAYSGERGA